MIAPAQDQWRDWAAHNPRPAARMKDQRDAWCRKHGYQIEELPKAIRTPEPITE